MLRTPPEHNTDALRKGHALKTLLILSVNVNKYGIFKIKTKSYFPKLLPILKTYVISATVFQVQLQLKLNSKLYLEMDVGYAPAFYCILPEGRTMGPLSIHPSRLPSQPAIQTSSCWPRTIPLFAESKSR